MDQSWTTTTGISILVAFPNTGSPSTFVQSGNYMALGMVAEGQSSAPLSCNDYYYFGMVYLTNTGQPAIMGEVWKACDVCPTVCQSAIFLFGAKWTCDCLTTTNYQKLIYLSMSWSSNLFWYANVGGVNYSLFSYTPESGEQPLFHIGTYSNPNCFGGTCTNAWYQFGIMTLQAPQNGWNAYVGNPSYLDASGGWPSVSASTWFGPQASMMDDIWEVGSKEGLNQGDSCRSGGSLPGGPKSLLFGQIVIHPIGATTSSHSLWDTGCPQDVYPPGASFTSPSPGSWENTAFSVSFTNFDNGPVQSGVALCFWSVESLNAGNWVTTLPPQLVACNSSQTVSVGGSGYCQSQGLNYCRVNVWSEDYMSNIGGTTTLMLPSNGDSWTENNANSWKFLSNGVPGSSSVSNDNSAGNFKVGSYSIKGNWAGMNPAPTTVALQYPGTGNLGLDFTTFGTKANPPLIIFFVKSDQTVYYPQVQFVTDYSTNAVFTSDSLPNVNGVSTSVWQMFQVAVGPYGNHFVSGPGANWASINQIQFLFSFNAPGSAAGNIWVDGVVFLNSMTTTTRYFSIDTVPPTAPALISPANGTTTSSNPPTLFSWSTASDATSGVASYTLQVSSDPVFSSPQTYSGITTTSYSLASQLSVGTWYWRVEARDNAGNVGPWSTTQSFTPALLASFTFSPSSPLVAQSITFTASTTGGSAPFSFSWSSTGASPATGSGSTFTTAYAVHGTYTMNLIVTDAKGNTASSSQSFFVHTLPLTASFTYTPSSPLAGQTVTFTGTASAGCSPYTVAWDFGDNSVFSTAFQVNHSYSSAGSYSVKMTVTDYCGTAITVTQTVTVSGDFTISANPTSFSILSNGVQASTQITLNSVGGFSGSITLGVPAASNGSPVLEWDSNGATQTTVQLSSTGPVSLYLYIISGSATGTFNDAVAGAASSPTIIVHQLSLTITVTASSGGFGSVGAGTLITLADRTQIPVQNLQVGARLLSYDMATRQYVVTTITRFVTVETHNQMVISTSSGKPLIVDQNPAQRLYVKLPDGTVALMSVTDLRVGFDLFDAISQTWVSITHIQYQNGGNHLMYDIYTTSPGNYIANGYLDPLKT